jgi:small subunit ribosomal protein S20
MANHKSALKRIRQNQVKRLHNKYFARTVRNAVRKFKETSDVKEATESLSKVESMVDKLAKINVIHKKKAANIKSQLSKHLNSLAEK